MSAMTTPVHVRVGNPTWFFVSRHVIAREETVAHAGRSGRVFGVGIGPCWQFAEDVGGAGLGGVDVGGLIALVEDVKVPATPRSST